MERSVFLLRQGMTQVARFQDRELATAVGLIAARAALAAEGNH